MLSHRPVLKRGVALGGAWAAVEDQENGGASSISNEKIKDDFGNTTYKVVYPVSGDNKNTSKYVAALKATAPMSTTTITMAMPSTAQVLRSVRPYSWKQTTSAIASIR